MSNVSYDLDTSGGLMPLIRALIKPPDEEVNVQKPKKPQHPYYKRPGKGHNHDSCDACGEGGDLICCDRCPASFHLGCYDPPLEENDIPAGLWLCRQCRASDAEKPPSARGSRAQSPVDAADKKTRSLRNSRANSAKKRSKEDSEEERERDREGDKEGEGLQELTPMETLVKAARIMNPRQFELPREMRVPCLFPGTDKEDSKNGGASLVSVDAWGLVPLPARLCFVCDHGCKAAPLLQCDYCPLLYHQDCLDPPLTALPTGRWMCPNHVEQYIDWKMVNSISATERVALWERFAAPVDQHAIKLDFIRRARNHKPNFRTKVPVTARGRVCVPAMVRAHYRQPPPLLPSRRDVLRCGTVLKRLKESGDYDVTSEEVGPVHQICMNLDCPQYQRPPRPCPCDVSAKHDVIKHDVITAKLQPASDKDAASDLHALSQPQHVTDEEDKHSDSSSDLSDSDFEYLTASVKRRRLGSGGLGGQVGGLGGQVGGLGGQMGGLRGRPAPRLELRSDDDVEQLLESVDTQLMQLDTRLVRLLAWQRLQQVLWGEQCSGAWSRAGVGAKVSAAVRRSVAGARLARRGARLPSALLSAADRRRITTCVWGAPPQAQPLPAAAPTALESCPVRAMLSPLHENSRNGAGDSVGAAVPMRGASITIGTDGRCGLRLSPACRRAAAHHATIFMDEVTRHFELINYSEWGTEVNGVMYACDVSPRATEAAEAGEPSGATGATGAYGATGAAGATGAIGATGADGDDRLQPLRELVRRREQPMRRINGELTLSLGDEGGCSCGARGGGLGGAGGGGGAAGGAWEGSALVPHGALLRFGCRNYVFSIADCLPLDEH